MAPNLAEMLKWPEYLQQIADSAEAKWKSGKNDAQTIKGLSDMSEWEGLGGDAARNALRRDHTKFDTTAQLAYQVMEGAKFAHTEAADLASRIQRIEQDAAADPAVKLNLVTGEVTGPDISHLNPKNQHDADLLTKIQEKITNIKNRVATAQHGGELVDSDLARVLNAATGGKVDPFPENRVEMPPGQKPAATTAAAADTDEKKQFPIPEQKVKDADQTKGTPFGKDILKDPEPGKSLPPGSVAKKWGEDAKVEKPKGPVLAGGTTGEHEATWWNPFNKEGTGPSWLGHPHLDADSKVGTIGGEAKAEGYKDGAVTDLKGHADVVNNKANATWDLGPAQVKLHLEGEAGVMADQQTIVNTKSGFQIGGDGMVGLRAEQGSQISAFGLTVKDNVNEYVGGGIAGDLHMGRTDDGKIAIGGHYGAAWGLGYKNGFEITINPGEVSANLEKAWKWVTD